MSVRPGHALDRWELGPVHSLDLLRSALDDDGCQHLGQADQARFQATYDDGDEGAFCRIAKATRAGRLPRRVPRLLPRAQGHAAWRPGRRGGGARTRLRGLAAGRGAITATAARNALGALAAASVDLPAAERLSDILYGLGEVAREEADAGSWRPYEEIVEDYLVVERVAPGRIWFLVGVGPIKVASEASALARVGWTVNLVLGRRGATWQVLEVGNVYPGTLA